MWLWREWRHHALFYVLAVMLLFCCDDAPQALSLLASFVVVETGYLYSSVFSAMGLIATMFQAARLAAFLLMYNCESCYSVAATSEVVLYRLFWNRFWIDVWNRFCMACSEIVYVSSVMEVFVSLCYLYFVLKVSLSLLEFIVYFVVRCTIDRRFRRRCAFSVICAMCICML